MSPDCGVRRLRAGWVHNGCTRSPGSGWQPRAASDLRATVCPAQRRFAPVGAHRCKGSDPTTDQAAGGSNPSQRATQIRLKRPDSAFSGIVCRSRGGVRVHNGCTVSVCVPRCGCTDLPGGCTRLPPLGWVGCGGGHGQAPCSGLGLSAVWVSPSAASGSLWIRMALATSSAARFCMPGTTWL